MRDEEELNDALLYPGPLEEGLVWAAANRSINSSSKRKKQVSARFQTRATNSRQLKIRYYANLATALFMLLGFGYVLFKLLRH